MGTTHTTYTFLIIFTVYTNVRTVHKAGSTEVSRKRLESAVALGRVREEVAHTAGVAPLVVVPRDQLHEVLVERNAGVGVEDRRVVVAGEVGRDDLVLGVADDALVGRLGRLLDGLLDLVVRSGLLETDDKVDDGDIDGGDTEGETTKANVSSSSVLPLKGRRT